MDDAEVESDFYLQLIELVQRHPVLYDRKDENYFRHNFKLQVWIDIAHECNKTSFECSHRWKLLRQRFCKELKKSPTTQGFKKIRTWCYFDKLMFLKNSISTRSPSINIERNNKMSNAKEEEEAAARVEEHVDIDDDEMHDEFESISSSSTTANRNKTNNVDDLYSSLETTINKLSNIVASIEQFPKSTEFASLQAMESLLQELPQYRRDEFLREMYAKLMDLRTQARACGELQEKR